MRIDVPGEFHEDRWQRTAEDSERRVLPRTPGARDEVVGGMESELVPTEPSQTYPAPPQSANPEICEIRPAGSTKRPAESTNEAG